MNILEKITDGIETWYEEIQPGNCDHINPYYALVVFRDRNVPLPFFFKKGKWDVLGGTRESKTEAPHPTNRRQNIASGFNNTERN